MSEPEKLYAVINAKGWLTTTVDEDAARRHNLASEGSTLAAYVPESKLTALQSKLERYERMETAMRVDRDAAAEAAEQCFPAGLVAQKHREHAIALAQYLLFLSAPNEPTDANA